jgi:glycosyltransferase involved in cell wall biosynthesis
MADELVSVVIPTFNYRAYVSQAVDSALAQTYANREIIVVDDGSTDHTDQMLAPYADRIRYIYQKNQGLSAARNTGIQAARGRWIALLDSDDLWHPRKLEVQMRYLARHPEIGLLAADPIPMEARRWPAVNPLELPAVSPITLEDLAVRSRFGPSSVVIRRECFDRAGLFDPELRSCEDRDMWIRIAAHFKIAKLHRPLWWYRVHPGNMHKAVVHMEEYEFRVLDKARSQLWAGRVPPRVQRMAFGFAHFASAIRYAEAGRHWWSLCKLIQSFVTWPFPYSVGIVRRPLERHRMFVVLLLRLLGLKAPFHDLDRHEPPEQP